MPRIRTTPSRNRGQASVEFLLSSVFFLTMIFAAVQLILVIYTYVLMAEAAKIGVRYAVVHGSNSISASGPGNTTGVQNAVKRIVNYSGMTITVTYPDGNGDPPSRVRVQVSYPFSAFSLGWPLPTIRASAQGRITF